MTAVRKRRSNAEIEVVKEAMLRIAEADQPVTIRQLYYRLVSERLIEKTEDGYRRVQTYTVELREEQRLPYEWIADHSRFVRRAARWDSPQKLMEAAIQQYKRNLWQSQGHRVQIWVEKDALVGVFQPITDEFGVPLFSSWGYSSLTFLKTAVAEILADASNGIVTHIYQYGDHDASGADIPRSMMERLRELGAGGLGAKFYREAVTPDQIVEMGLPTRPQKSGDSRARNFEGEAVEVDAIPPATLREMVQGSIEAEIDWKAWNAEAARGEQDREDLEALAADFDALLAKIRTK